MGSNASTPGSGDARRVVVGASLVFAILLLAGGALILWLRHQDPLTVFHTEQLGQRVLLGAVTGVLAAVACAAVVWRVPRLARLRALAEHAVEGIEPRWHTTVVVALAAGVSEEYFFRGALEPAVGRWIASLAFIILHGAFRLRDRGVAAFAVFLFAASTGLSALNARGGLECAMAAHTVYDLAMLAWLARRIRPRQSPSN